MLKIYPEWSFFLNEVMDRLQPFWEETQWKERVHFIHLIGYGSRNKARKILIDLIELLDWQSESLFLFQDSAYNSPSVYSQAVSFQESFSHFPKLVITDFLNDFFWVVPEADEMSEDFRRVKDFFLQGSSLDLQRGVKPSDARGGLVISYLDSFHHDVYLKSRLIFKFHYEYPSFCFEGLRDKYIPDEIRELIREGYVFKEQLIFFSKDDPKDIQLAFDLIRIKKMLEENSQELLNIKVSISFNSMDYLHTQVYYKKLSFNQLKQASFDFFTPVYWQFKRMVNKIRPKPTKVEIDFRSGWKFNALAD